MSFNNTQLTIAIATTQNRFNSMSVDISLLAEHFR